MPVGKSPIPTVGEIELTFDEVDSLSGLELDLSALESRANHAFRRLRHLAREGSTLPLRTRANLHAICAALLVAQVESFTASLQPLLDRASSVRQVADSGLTVLDATPCHR